MKKRILSMILTFVMVLSMAMPTFAAEESTAWGPEDFTYAEIDYLSSDTVSAPKQQYVGLGVSGFSESGIAKVLVNPNIVIPSRDPNGTPVIGICENAFNRTQSSKKEWGTIESVTFPKDVDGYIIMASAFKNNSITQLDLSGVEIVCRLAFQSNASLESVKFDEKIWQIEQQSFAGNKSIKTISFPSKTNKPLNIDAMAFAINAITEVSIPSNTEKLPWNVFLQNTGKTAVPDDCTHSASKKGGVVFVYTDNFEHFNKTGIQHLKGEGDGISTNGTKSWVQRLIYTGSTLDGRNYESGANALAAAEAGTGVIIDVRAKEKNENLFLTNSHHQPMFTLNESGGNVVTTLKDNLALEFITFADSSEALADKNIYILCNSGKSGADAATKLLLSAGYSMENIFTITGGATDSSIMNAFEVRTEGRTDVTGAEALDVVNNPGAHEDVVIIDVRAKEKYATGHLKGSISLPLFSLNESGGNVPTNLNDDLSTTFTAYVKENASSLKEKQIYVLCNSGASGAKNAAKLLYTAGYNLDNVHTIVGGAKGTDTDKSMPENLKYVSAEQAIKVMNDENYVIVDVRAKEKYKAGHLEGSISLPLFTVNADGANVATDLNDDLAKEFLAYVAANPSTFENKTVYILCNSGQSGVINGFKLFEKAGYTDKVYGIEGGAKNESIQKLFVTEKENAFVNLSATKFVYNGKQQTPNVIVKNKDGKALVKDTDYEVSYSSATRKKVGRYTIKVTLKGDYTGSQTLKYTIVPKASSTLTSNLYQYGNKVRLSWTKSTGATGYRVEIKKPGAKTYTFVTNTTNLYYIRSGMYANKTYSFKITPYYMTNGVKYYSTSSAAYKTTKITTTKKGTKIVQVAKPTVKKSGTKVKVSWKNIPNESGYQISRSKTSTGTYIASTFATTKADSRLVTATKGTKYYYKVRAYKTVNGKRIYGMWSPVISYTR